MESLSIVLQRSPWPPAFGQPLHPFVSRLSSIQCCLIIIWLSCRLPSQYCLKRRNLWHLFHLYCQTVNFTVWASCTFCQLSSVLSRLQQQESIVVLVCVFLINYPCNSHQRLLISWVSLMQMMLIWAFMIIHSSFINEVFTTARLRGC